MSSDLLSVFDDVVRLEIELWNAVERRLRNDHDLELSWFEVTRAVAGREAATVSEITRELIITVGGASKLVDRIEAAGYLARRPNPADGRSSLIHVTDAGQRMLRRAESTVVDELQSILGTVLPAKEWRQFADSLSAIRTALPHHVDTESDRTA
ncbi:MAG: MarR family winged helix-turn-helix transcriptional regulator [Acidimicrobiia bacterium]|nr:MarR family winged helix-turn-helix transcriptional regulator [Acidimicrobiia bacterium]MDH4352675.1 MarR family winged helix-turn-helix transcriptional regulator [Actinomycetota bacterium]